MFKPAWTRDGQRFEAEDYAVRIAHGGRRETVSLQTPDARKAAARAARFYDVLKANGWEAALSELSPEQARAKASRGGLTVGALITLAQQHATHVKPVTVRQYVNALRWLVALVAGIEGTEARYDYRGGGNAEWTALVDAVPLSALTGEAIDAAIGEYVRRRGGTDTARRTAASMLRQARGLWAARLLDKLRIADISNPFRGRRIEQPAAPTYKRPFESVDVLVAAARKELRDTDAQAWTAFVLLLGAGLRKGEADALLWGDVDEARGTVSVREGKSAASRRSVTVGADTMAEIIRGRKASATAEDFVLDGRQGARRADRRDYRAKPTFERLQAWLRAHGVVDRKPLHTLRKEAGSLINATSGIFEASRFLGHASVAVTAAHYLEVRNKSVVGAFESKGPEAQRAP